MVGGAAHEAQSFGPSPRENLADVRHTGGNETWVVGSSRRHRSWSAPSARCVRGAWSRPVTPPESLPTRVTSSSPKAVNSTFSPQADTPTPRKLEVAQTNLEHLHTQQTLRQIHEIDLQCFLAQVFRGFRLHAHPHLAKPGQAGKLVQQLEKLQPRRLGCTIEHSRFGLLRWRFMCCRRLTSNLPDRSRQRYSYSLLFLKMVCMDGVQLLEIQAGSSG